MDYNKLAYNVSLGIGKVEYLLVKRRISFKGYRIKDYINKYSDGYAWDICCPKMGLSYKFDFNSQSLELTGVPVYNVRDCMLSREEIVLGDCEFEGKSQYSFADIEEVINAIKVSNKSNINVDNLIILSKKDHKCVRGNDIEKAINTNNLEKVVEALDLDMYDDDDIFKNAAISIAICDAILFSTPEIVKVLLNSKYYNKYYSVYQIYCNASALYSYDLIKDVFGENIDFNVADSLVSFQLIQEQKV